MRMCSIASGSSGNCIYVGSDTAHILIDAGISGKRITQGVEALGVSMKELDGIFVTHEHIDHVKSLGVLARKYEIPIYATNGTIEAILRENKIGKVDRDLFFSIETDEKFPLKDLTILPIRTSHDAAQPCAYRVGCGRCHVAVMTDLGYYDDYIAHSLEGLNALLLESNHDVRMLQAGSYPYPLKQRILGNKGHLSNEAAGQLLSRVLHDDLQAIMLGHLSKENNLPELAFETVRTEIAMSDTPYGGSDFPLVVAKREEPSEVVHLL